MGNPESLPEIVQIMSFKVLVAAVLLVCLVDGYKLASVRKAMATLAIVGSCGLGTSPALAASSAVKPDFTKPSEAVKAANPVTISGIITLEDGVAVPEAPTRALYITAKPDLGFINSNLLLRKFPAVMSKRIPGESVTFPLEYSISESADGTEDVALQRERWVNLPMIISVRYDTDGVAATRDPTDLVGKGDSSRNQGDDTWVKANLALSDRGVGGKLVTAKQ